MKISKYLTLSILFFCSTLIKASGQPREDVKRNTYVEKSQVLFHATGWKKHEELGKWISNQNCISQQTVEGFIDTSKIPNFKAIYTISIDHKYPASTERFYVLI